MEKSETPDLTDQPAVTQIPIGENDNIKSYLYGYFKAPFAGEYVFFIASDDNANVYLTANGTRTQIIDFNSWNSIRKYFNSDSRESAPLTLERTRLTT